MKEQGDQQQQQQLATTKDDQHDELNHVMGPDEDKSSFYNAVRNALLPLSLNRDSETVQQLRNVVATEIMNEPQKYEHLLPDGLSVGETARRIRQGEPRVCTFEIKAMAMAMDLNIKILDERGNITCYGNARSNRPILFFQREGHNYTELTKQDFDKDEEESSSSPSSQNHIHSQPTDLNFMERNGLRLLDVEQDANSLFVALGVGVGVASFYVFPEMRKWIAEEVEKNGEKYMRYLKKGEGIRQRVTKILNRGKGDELEILATMNAFSVNVYVHRPNSGIDNVYSPFPRFPGTAYIMEDGGCYYPLELIEEEESSSIPSSSSTNLDDFEFKKPLPPPPRKHVPSSSSSSSRSRQLKRKLDEEKDPNVRRIVFRIGDVKCTYMERIDATTKKEQVKPKKPVEKPTMPGCWKKLPWENDMDEAAIKSLFADAADD